MPNAPDLAQIRFDNAMLLFDEFVHNTIKHPDAATLRGLEGRFAEKVQIQPSYWSQIKSRSRQIGERLARQFEQLCRKPNGWMDQVRGPVAMPSTSAQKINFSNESPVPKDDDERFLMGLVLSYYRRHPERARARLLELLGEVLMPSEAGSAPPVPGSSGKPVVAENTPDKTLPASVDAHALWLRSQAGVAPLRRKK
jgi:hypothetical protein